MYTGIIRYNNKNLKIETEVNIYLTIYKYILKFDKKSGHLLMAC